MSGASPFILVHQGVPMGLPEGTGYHDAVEAACATAKHVQGTVWVARYIAGEQVRLGESDKHGAYTEAD